jgi:hypothetical protein
MILCFMLLNIGPSPAPWSITTPPSRAPLLTFTDTNRPNILSIIISCSCVTVEGGEGLDCYDEGAWGGGRGA